MAARRSTLYLGDWDEGQEALDKVEVRGCFDHLHDGHKELLETAVLVANEKLIVAIIADPNKSYMGEYDTRRWRSDEMPSCLSS